MGKEDGPYYWTNRAIGQMPPCLPIEGSLGMECSQVIFSRHAVERMFQRGISPKMILDLLQSGEVIASYPEDKPYPSVLLLGFALQQPVHAVVARDFATGACYLVTVYRPDPLLWGPDFKTRS